MAFRKSKIVECAVTAPSFFWLTLLFVIPTIIVFAIAFKPADPYGGVGGGWTLHTILTLSNPNYPAIIWRTIWISIITTLFCVVLGIPTGYCLARVSARWRHILLVLIVVPFWTSFLVRVFAWKVLLHPDGFLKRMLVALDVLRPDSLLLYNDNAVLLVMVYTYLPFAILPIYAATEKFDFHLIEAARDLGATRFQTLFKVFLPGIQRGLITAFLVVFIPALGSYVIPDIVGGLSSEMIGNKIAQRTFVDRHLPHASALSALLTLAVLVPLIAIFGMQKRKSKEPPTLIETA